MEICLLASRMNLSSRCHFDFFSFDRVDGTTLTITVYLLSAFWTSWNVIFQFMSPSICFRLKPKKWTNPTEIILSAVVELKSSVWAHWGIIFLSFPVFPSFQGSSRAPVTLTCAGSPLMSRDVSWNLALGHMEAGPWTWKCWRQISLATLPTESGILLVKVPSCDSDISPYTTRLFLTVLLQRSLDKEMSASMSAAMSHTLTSPSRWWCADGPSTTASICSFPVFWSPLWLCSSFFCLLTPERRSH